MTYIKSYTLEELANLIFIGGYIAALGPPKFRLLWSYLQPAVKHYLFGYGASAEDIVAAGRNMRKFADELERRVLVREVRFSELLRH